MRQGLLATKQVIWHNFVLAQGSLFGWQMVGQLADLPRMALVPLEQRQ